MLIKHSLRTCVCAYTSALLASGSGQFSVFSRGWGRQSALCKMISRVPGLYSLDARTTLPLSSNNHKCLQTLSEVS